MTDESITAESRSAINRPVPAPPNSLRRVVGVSMISRLAHDLSIRVVYPFLPEIASGLRVPVEQVGAAWSLRSGVEILSPLAGAISDRVGHRRSMSLALVVLAIGLAITGQAGGLSVATLGFILSGIGTAIYIPALIAYVSERTPYARRGRVLGAIELTWAASGLVGVPIAGVLLESLGWRAPFAGLAAAALICAGLTLALEETPLAARARAEPLRLGAILSHRSAIAFLLASLMLFFAFENIQVGYASWFESRFGLDPAQRGTLQSLFGVFEIAASSSVSLFLDRIGKKRGVAGGLAFALLGYLLLASVGPLALPLGLVAMSVAFLGFEFGVVASIPIASEQMPQARGTMLALTVMSSGLGRLFGGVSGSALLAGPGFPFAALISAGVAVVTIAVFALGVRERRI